MQLEEFIKQCISLGYGSKKDVQTWCENNSKDEYTEDDLIELYRDIDRGYFGTKWRTIYGGHKSTKHYNNVLTDH
jgi:hypothetical protein